MAGLKGATTLPCGIGHVSCDMGRVSRCAAIVEKFVTPSDFYRFVFRYGVVGFCSLCIIGALGLKLSLYYRPIMTRSDNDEDNEAD